MLGKLSVRHAPVAAVLVLLALIPTLGKSAEATQATPVLRVTYIEFSPHVLGRAAVLLDRYARLERRAMRSNPAADFFVTVLQELGRSQRWVLLQGAASTAELAAADAASNEVWRQIEPLLLAPSDQRRNHPVPGNAAPARAARGTRVALYEVTHLDIGDPEAIRHTAGEAVQAFIDGAAASRGNLGAEVWQQDGHPNHYALILQWASYADRDAFADGSAARAFRRQVAPLIGSPMDEQLFRRRD